MFQALYRRLRSTRFSEILGQDVIVAALTNQVKTGRIHHAYLFSGVRGTGKTSTARVFARAMNCLNPENGDLCGKCDVCDALSGDSSLDIVEMDAASNRGVDDVRKLRDDVIYPPQTGKYKVYIIDEAHMLSREAFNALLKTLEEPPPHAVFILATTEPHKLPPTILSRCQRYDFKRITTPIILKQLMYACQTVGATYEDEALKAIARAGDGSMRDALSILDSCLSSSGGHLSREAAMECLGVSGTEALEGVARAFAEGDSAGALAIVDDFISNGGDIGVFTRDLAEHMRKLVIASICGEDGAKIIDAPGEEYAALGDQAALLGRDRAERAMEILVRTEAGIRASVQPRLLLETAVLKICRPDADSSYAAVAERIGRLEKMAQSGAFQAFAPQAAHTRAPAAQPALAPKTQQQTAAPKNEGEVWRSVQNALKKERIAIFSMIRKAALTRIDGSTAMLEFPPDAGTMLAAITKEENLRFVEQAFSNACGREMTVKAVLGGAQTGYEPQPPPPDADKELYALFGGENLRFTGGSEPQNQSHNDRT